MLEAPKNGRRRNLIDGVREYWRPLPITRSRTRKAKLISMLQRFVDLQYGSIVRDLRHELSRARGTVLDVGCGGQPFRFLLSPDVNYTGIDIADAKSKFGYTQPDTIFYDGDVWPVETGDVDVVMCTETLEHVMEPAQFLSEARRCLKPGGFLVLTVPFAARWHFIPYDYWRFTPAGMQHLLSVAGFADIKIFGRGNSLTVACYKIMTLYLAASWPFRRNLLGQSLAVLTAVVFSPVFLFFVLLGNVSLSWDGANDYLGLTVTARSQN